MTLGCMLTWTCPALPSSEIAKRTSGHKDYKKPHVGPEDYETMYKESITQPDKFFDRMAQEHLSFDRPYKTIMHGGFKDGDIAWFPEGSEYPRLSCSCLPLPGHHITCAGLGEERKAEVIVQEQS